MDRYQKTVRKLYQLQWFGIKLGLTNIRRLLEFAGQPQRSFWSIHIAGTNGKGSTAAIIAAVLQQAGYRTGFYTSPHLKDIRERIRINQQKISKSDLIHLVESFGPVFRKTRATFFEALTALAFTHFARQKVEWAIIETGMGGRLDATNVVQPLASVITNISLDHQEYLGKTKLKIAEEKMGIIKHDSLLVTAEDDGRIGRNMQTRCRQLQAEYLNLRDSRYSSRRLTPHQTIFDFTWNNERLQNLALPLAGSHQIKNGATAILTLLRLKNIYPWFRLSKKNIYLGLLKTRWAGRLQCIGKNPLVVADGAHNPAGFLVCRNALKEIYRYKKLFIIFGVLADKDYRSFFQILAPLAYKVILARPASERALAPQIMAKEFSRKGLHSLVILDVKKALRQTRSLAGKDDMILITGSIYTISEILSTGLIS